MKRKSKNKNGGTSGGLSKGEEIKRTTHLTRPPRLEGAVKNAKMYSPKKKKKSERPHEV